MKIPPTFTFEQIWILYKANYSLKETVLFNSPFKSKSLSYGKSLSDKNYLEISNFLASKILKTHLSSKFLITGTLI